MANWTDEQLRAIELRDRNLLVSAAAGSGKTAVLVERIVSRVLDKDNPIDIDSILVVTFTQAAAQEMRKRIGAAFQDQLRSNPDNRFLRKQIMLLENARIMTIDSFCMYVLKNYFNTIGLDPAFKVGDEGELKLIRADVMNELLEKHYSDGDEDFIRFAEAYAPGKSDSRLEELITRLYDYSQSAPWPEKWLDDCISMYNVSSKDELCKLDIIKDKYEQIRQLFKEYSNILGMLAIESTKGVNAPHTYSGKLQDEADIFEELSEYEDPTKFIGKDIDIFTRLPAAPKGLTDTSLKDIITSQRDIIKKSYKSIRDSYMCMNVDKALEDIKIMAPFAGTLVSLTKEFSEAYRQEKNERNIIDFSDGEHLTLQVLVDHDDKGQTVCTDTADELSQLFEEIYIDEYQDSNRIQEYILTSVSRVRYGRPNIFMVGDVKQNIYRFRQADPSLFIEKYNTYTKDDSLYQRVELHKNFRSRSNVLYSINDIFKNIMIKGFGGIEYTDGNMLNPGRDFEEKVNDDTELILTDSSCFKEDDLSSTELSAYMSAMKIRDLVGKDGYNYKDIVILLRSTKNTAPVYTNILMNYGIPAVSVATSGYFDAYEVVRVMNLLGIIDNPRQETLLASVLRSYWCYFSASELAQIKVNAHKLDLYDSLRHYMKEGTNTTIVEKIQEFMDFLGEYRRKASYMSIRDLIWDIVHVTGYYNYVGTMPGGRRRTGNLNMLVEKAADYARTSYSGLFNFLRYIEKIKNYDVDYGEASELGGGENVVRIMSIHKSKGLEFPVVILGNIDSRFNMMDQNQPVVFSDKDGLGINVVDLNSRVKHSSLYRKIINDHNRIETVTEETRILYVAMTRAVNKLIIVGAVDKCADKATAWEATAVNNCYTISYLMSCSNSIDLIAPAFFAADRTGTMRFNVVPQDSLIDFISRETKSQILSFSDKLEQLASMEPDEDTDIAIRRILDYQYPYRAVIDLHSKVSVSELKHEAMENADEEVHLVEPEHIKPVPSFAQEEIQTGGVARGNAYHKIFELFVYSRCSDVQEIQQMIQDFKDQGKIPEEYADAVRADKFLKFINTALGRRMKTAWENGSLRRERQFTMGIGADQIKAEYPDDEVVIIQGIIDCYFEENGEIVLVDYKTDYIPSDREASEFLTSRYKKQLELYRDALNRLTGLKVKDIYIYSVSQDKEILVS